MATGLPPEQEASYSAIIDQILAVSDLTTVSAKRIRKGLQEKVEYDLTPQKAEINALINLRFDKFQSQLDSQQHSASGDSTEPPAPEPAPTTNGATVHPLVKPEPARDHTSEPTSPAKRKAASDDDLSSVLDSPPPAKKPKKVKTSIEETDEELAKRLAAELNGPPTRSTRGGGSGSAKKKQVVKKAKTPKKKSKAKVNSDDDSSLENDSDKPEKERKGGFHKPMLLSEPLSALLSEPVLSRPQTVKRIWAYVKAHELQDPNDKRQIRCDDAMRAVFKQDRVHMFTMNKLLAQHLYAQDE